MKKKQSSAAAAAAAQAAVKPRYQNLTLRLTKEAIAEIDRLRAPLMHSRSTFISYFFTTKKGE